MGQPWQMTMAEMSTKTQFRLLSLHGRWSKYDNIPDGGLDSANFGCMGLYIQYLGLKWQFWSNSGRIAWIWMGWGLIGQWMSMATWFWLYPGESMPKFPCGRGLLSQAWLPKILKKILKKTHDMTGWSAGMEVINLEWNWCPYLDPP